MRSALRTLPLVLAVAALPISRPAAAQPLNVVTVSAPQINCVFNTSCRVTVSDVASPLLGSGFLQSRTFQAAAGSPAAGKWVYQYRVDLTNVTGAAAPPQVTTVAMPFGAYPVAMDFNGDGTATDQVFVVTGGALGAVKPNSVHQHGDTLYLTFTAPPVNAGQSSFFVGIVSLNPPRDVMARVSTNVAGDVQLRARGPELGWETPSSASPAPVAAPRARPARPVRPPAAGKP